MCADLKIVFKSKDPEDRGNNIDVSLKNAVWFAVFPHCSADLTVINDVGCGLSGLMTQNSGAVQHQLPSNDQHVQHEM